jgi:hypothetical protein
MTLPQQSLWADGELVNAPASANFFCVRSGMHAASGGIMEWKIDHSWLRHGIGIVHARILAEMLSPTSQQRKGHGPARDNCATRGGNPAVRGVA